MSPKLKFVCIGVVILLMSGCNDSGKNKTRSNLQASTKVITSLDVNSLTKPGKEFFQKSGKYYIKQPLPIPKMSGFLVKTSYIGTPEHPTIDGGIINSTDVPIINNDAPLDVKVGSKAVKRISFIKNTSIPIHDDWATNTKIKKFLLEANTEGKLDYVLKKIDQMNLPASIAVIPMVESSYNRDAISSKGAGGAWQLMPTTARMYGIKDQDRFKFNKSTDTALKLLNDLHEQFGNWSLAFAAYNAGSNNVLIAIQKNPHAQSIDELDLPLETKTYVRHVMSLNKKLVELEKYAV